jgi:hypothetical protein
MVNFSHPAKPDGIGRMVPFRLRSKFNDRRRHGRRLSARLCRFGAAKPRMPPLYPHPFLPRFEVNGREGRFRQGERTDFDGGADGDTVGGVRRRPFRSGFLRRSFFSGAYLSRWRHGSPPLSTEIVLF